MAEFNPNQKQLDRIGNATRTVGVNVPELGAADLSTVEGWQSVLRRNHVHLQTIRSRLISKAI